MKINTLQKLYNKLKLTVMPDSDEKSLEEQVNELKQKLHEKQEQINKTNAYWKKKFYGLKLKKSKE